MRKDLTDKLLELLEEYKLFDRRFHCLTYFTITVKKDKYPKIYLETEIKELFNKK